MHVCAILNAQSGTLRTADMDDVCQNLRTSFEDAGHTLDIAMLGGNDLMAALKEAAQSDKCDCVLVAGGDGTASAAASICWRHNKTMALLPGGTMNLFAHSLKIPLNIPDAIEALASGKPKAIDIATANGRPFIHQISVGFQARAIQLRNKMKYGSRYGKMVASLKAIAGVVFDPPTFRAIVKSDSDTSLPERVSAVAVSNNVFGEGHMPYADRLTTGKLGIYCSEPVTSREAVKLVYHIMVGAWSSSDELTVASASQTELNFPDARKRTRALIDGELIPLEKSIDIKLHPGELKMLLPATDATKAL